MGNNGQLEGKNDIPVRKTKHLQHHTIALRPMDYQLALMVALIIEELPGRQK